MRDQLLTAAAFGASVFVVGLGALPSDPAPPVLDEAAPVVYAGPMTAPAAPEPHVYSVALSDGSTQSVTVANDCGSGCFTLEGRRYIYMPDGQWRTPRFYDETGVTCADGHTEGAWAMWVTDDLVHFSTDIPPGDHCGAADTVINPITFTLTISY